MADLPVTCDLPLPTAYVHGLVARSLSLCKLATDLLCLCTYLAHHEQGSISILLFYQYSYFLFFILFLLLSLCPCMQMTAREVAVEEIWDISVVAPTNSVIKFAHHCEKGGEQAGISAQWQAPGNTTQTHSELVMPHAKPFLHVVW